MNCPVALFIELPDEMKMWFIDRKRFPQVPSDTFREFSKEIKRAIFLTEVNKHSGVRLNTLTTECWNWEGTLDGNGYGHVQTNWGKEIGRYAHRISYLYFNGDIPDNQLIRHKCDNRRCVNPDHLEIGTKKENNRDCRERNPRASGRKLQPSEYPKIMERWTNGELLKDIAKEYGMNWKSISRALKKWTREAENVSRKDK
jgi:hypothetical protein